MLQHYIENRTADASAPAILRVLRHRPGTKAARAVWGAYLIEGGAVVSKPTLKAAAEILGCSISSIVRALRLSPSEREQVRQGRRPLVAPLSEVEQARRFVDRLGGIDRVLDLLAKIEQALAT